MKRYHEPAPKFALESSAIMRYEQNSKKIRQTTVCLCFAGCSRPVVHSGTIRGGRARVNRDEMSNINSELDLDAIDAAEAAFFASRRLPAGGNLPHSVSHSFSPPLRQQQSAHQPLSQPSIQRPSFVGGRNFDWSATACCQSQVSAPAAEVLSQRQRLSRALQVFSRRVPGTSACPLRFSLDSETHFLVLSPAAGTVLSSFFRECVPSCEFLGRVGDHTVPQQINAGGVEFAWRIPLTDYYAVVSLLRHPSAASAVRIGIAGQAGCQKGGGLLPPTVERLFVRSDWSPPHDCRMMSTASSEPLPVVPVKPSMLSGIPQELWCHLFPYQREGVCFGVARNGRVLLGDEMGLGKTLQALAIALSFPQDWPLLCIVPSSLRVQWADVIRKWATCINTKEVVVLFRKSDAVGLEPGRVKALVVSYDLLSDAICAQKIRDLDCGICICDESHYLKNPQAQRTKAVRGLLARAPHVIMISGTPALSRPKELHTQLVCLMPDLFPSNFHEFGLRYCNGHQTPWQQRWDFNGSSNARELNLILKRAVMIRRHKADVLHQLPPKVRTRISVSIAPSHRKALAKIGLRMRGKGNIGVKSKGSSTPSVKGDDPAVGRKVAMLEFFKHTGIAKLPETLAYLAHVLATGSDKSAQHETARDDGIDKLLVFAHHKDVLDGVQEFLDKHHIGFVRIDGGTPSDKRQDFVDLFQDPESGCRVALLSITAAGVGITLTAARMVVFAELAWNPGTLQQAEDRVHRIGQQASSVDIHYLIAQDTLDELMWSRVISKLEVLGTALDGRKSTTSGESTRTGLDIHKEQVTEFEQRYRTGDAEEGEVESLCSDDQFIQNLLDKIGQVEKDDEVRGERRGRKRERRHLQDTLSASEYNHSVLGAKQSDSKDSSPALPLDDTKRRKGEKEMASFSPKISSGDDAALNNLIDTVQNSSAAGSAMAKLMQFRKMS